jgi:hypothetical protein
VPSMISFSSLIATLGRSQDAPPVKALLSRVAERYTIQRIEQLGFWECREEGLSLVLKDDLYLASAGRRFRTDGPMTVVAVHLYSAGFEGYRQYRGQLIGTLGFADGREQVIQNLGPPAKTGGGNDASGRIWPYWDRFDYPEYSLRVQYDPGRSRIDILTLMALSER